jgi:flagellar hook capping protein FlgD
MILLALLAAPGAQAGPATVSVTLRWRAPGDDGMVGRARAYLLRYSTLPITEANFNSATPIGGVPAPGLPGSTETFTVTGLIGNRVYYLAIKTLDDAGNWSALSNVAVYTSVTGVEDLPASLSFSTPWPNPARGWLRCAFALPQGETVQVDAFGVDGRHVRSLASGWRPAGRSEVAWDLRDDAGNRVPAGVYLVRARLGVSLWTRRATVLP